MGLYGTSQNAVEYEFDFLIKKSNNSIIIGGHLVVGTCIGTRD